MIYVPMLKTRREELGVAKNMNYCFSDNIIPLFEILTDQYETKYKIDPITQSFIYERKGKQNRRIKEVPTDSDIITLDYINKIIGQKKAFIDYFRFTIKKYGNNVNVKRTDLALRLSRDPLLYKSRVREVSKYNNLIPIISIKDGFEFSKNELESFLNELRSENGALGLRITEEFLEDNKETIKDLLRKTDYLLFDIGEQNPNSKFIELEEVMELGTNAKIILVNSPRKADISNGEYEEHGITNLIDNSARIIYDNYNFQGFGDYIGIKDSLPSNDGGNGTGAALALIYEFKNNCFISYLNRDTSQGIYGYNKIIPIILSEKNALDPYDSCPAIKKIEDLKTTGHWSTWHNITMTRYLHQMNLNINK